MYIIKGKEPHLFSLALYDYFVSYKSNLRVGFLKLGGHISLRSGKLHHGIPHKLRPGKYSFMFRIPYHVVYRDYRIYETSELVIFL